MPRREDISYLIGTKVGGTLILAEEPNPLVGKRARRLLKCLCQCGKEFITPLYSIKCKRPRAKSCGCARDDSTSKRFAKLGLPKGYQKNCDRSLPEFSVWSTMVYRCYSNRYKDYTYYKGKGIKVCDRWIEPDGQGFKNFIEDMGRRPDGCVLDREDGGKGYSPENCRWVTPSLNSFNITVRKNNTSGKIGVWWLEKYKKWRAGIRYQNKQIYLGCFDLFEDAVAARKAAELHYFGVNLEI